MRGVSMSASASGNRAAVGDTPVYDSHSRSNSGSTSAKTTPAASAATTTTANATPSTTSQSPPPLRQQQQPPQQKQQLPTPSAMPNASQRLPFPPQLHGVFWPSVLPPRWGEHVVRKMEPLPGTSGNEKEVNCVAASPDCSRFATACDDAIIRVYSMRGTDVGRDVHLDAELKGSLGFVDGLCFVPYAPQFLLSGSGSSERPVCVRLWDTSTKHQCTLEPLPLGDMGWIWAIACVLPASGIFACGGFDGGIHIIKVGLPTASSSHGSLTFLHTISGQHKKKIRCIVPFPQPNSFGGGGGVTFAAVSADATDTVKFHRLAQEDGHALLSSVPIADHRPGQDRAGVTALALDSVGKKMALGLTDGNVHLVDLTAPSVNFQQLRVGGGASSNIPPHEGQVFGLRFMGQRLVSCARDQDGNGVMMLWCWRTGAPLLKHPHPTGSSCFAAEWVIGRDLSSNKFAFCCVLVGTKQKIVAVEEANPSAPQHSESAGGAGGAGGECPRCGQAEEKFQLLMSDYDTQARELIQLQNLVERGGVLEQFKDERQAVMEAAAKEVQRLQFNHQEQQQEHTRMLEERLSQYQHYAEGLQRQLEAAQNK